MRSINLDNIEDKPTRDALIAIKSIIFEDLPILRGDWSYFVVEVDAGGTYLIEHNLGYAPSDFLVTFDSADTTINYSDITDEVVSYTTVSGGIIRGFHGKYEENTIV